MIRAAKFVIWSFFLLIFSNGVGITAGKYGMLPGRPIFYYAAIVAGLLGAALLTERWRGIRGEGAFFGIMACIALIGAAMMSQAVGPDFGGKVLFDLYIPSKTGAVLWPILNTLAAAALYVLARSETFRATIMRAVVVTLLIQVATMEADMWWPAIFGDPNGRAGGLAQNANQAALMMTVLASLLLPSTKEPLSSGAIYAFLVAIAAVALTQSKTGAVLLLALAIGLGLAWMQGSRSGRINQVAVAAIVAALAGTVVFSPVLNGTVAFPAPMINGTQLSPADVAAAKPEVLEHFNKAAPLDGPVSLDERLRLRSSLDDGAAMRIGALWFYLDILRSHPFGLGTGFTNKFVTGPHNSPLKLAVENGIVAAVLLLALLFTVTWRALKSGSPQLVSLSLIAWVTAMLYHTMLLDPIILPALAIGLAVRGIRPVFPSPK